MKSLKFDHQTAQAIATKQKTSTWRINDDKDLSLNDRVAVIDKVDPHKKDSWVAIGEITINSITEMRLGDIDPKNPPTGHESYASQEAMYAEFRGYYGNTIGPKTPVKIISFHFEPTDETHQNDHAVMNTGLSVTEMKMYADGGSRGNPGPSASGFVLMDMDENILETDGVYLGVTTNNQAEYHGLKRGLERAHEMGARIVHVHLDSLLVVNQMLGKFKVRNRDLWPVHDSIKTTVTLFDRVTFTHVPRELNKLADSEVNRILDNAAK